MTETNSKIVIAVAGQPIGNNVEFSLDQLQGFLEEGYLKIEENSLILIQGIKPRQVTTELIFPFTGMTNCLKCNEQNPYRKGMTTYDKEMDLLTRRCSGCGFEWLEHCGDFKEKEDPGNGPDEATETA